MKTLFLFTLTIILSINLNARENPFAVTDAYEEASAKIFEINETPKTLESSTRSSIHQRNARKDVKGKKPKSRCK
jgi:hypothetical protein